MHAWARISDGKAKKQLQNGGRNWSVFDKEDGMVEILILHVSNEP